MTTAAATTTTTTGLNGFNGRQFGRTVSSQALPTEPNHHHHRFSYHHQQQQQQQQQQQLPQPLPPQSRYMADFNELGVLGSGSSGVVFKVRKKIDGCMYAVKRVEIGNGQTQMREVFALAATNNDVARVQSMSSAGSSSSSKIARPSSATSSAGSSAGAVVLAVMGASPGQSFAVGSPVAMPSSRQQQQQQQQQGGGSLTSLTSLESSTSLDTSRNTPLVPTPPNNGTTTAETTPSNTVRLIDSLASLNSSAHRTISEEAALSLSADTECPIHILRYYNAWIEDGHLYIQTELCEKTLNDVAFTAERRQKTFHFRQAHKHSSSSRSSRPSSSHHHHHHAAKTGESEIIKIMRQVLATT
jgi:hypothetical protein